MWELYYSAEFAREKKRKRDRAPLEGVDSALELQGRTPERRYSGETCGKERRLRF